MLYSLQQRNNHVPVFSMIMGAYRIAKLDILEKSKDHIQNYFFPAIKLFIKRLKKRVVLGKLLKPFMDQLRTSVLCQLPQAVPVVVHVPLLYPSHYLLYSNQRISMLVQTQLYYRYLLQKEQRFLLQMESPHHPLPLRLLSQNLLSFPFHLLILM